MSMDALVCVCMYVYVYVYVCVCVCACVHISVFQCLAVCVCVDVVYTINVCMMDVSACTCVLQCLAQLYFLLVILV